MERLQSYKKALESNKDDTAELITVIADMQQQADGLEQQLNYYEYMLKSSNSRLKINYIVASAVPIAVCGTMYFTGLVCGADFDSSFSKVTLGSLILSEAVISGTYWISYLVQKTKK